jgi:ABC-type branched-subunit amino acid transport system substrate-binding protein
MLGFKGSFYSALLDQTRVDIANGALEGAISAQFPEGSQDFVKIYTQKFGKKPNTSADTSHDALIALSKAIIKAKSIDAIKVVPELLKVQFQGASGYIQFDSFGGVIREPVYIQVKDSKITRIKSTS